MVQMRMENNEPQNKYIEGWLEYKESKQYKMYWFVLKAQSFDSSNKLMKAHLFCFVDQNTHIKEKYVGSYPITPPTSVVTLVKKDSGKPSKFDFVIKLNNAKFNFRARDEITRERWIHALCNLVGKGLPPGQIPSFDSVPQCTTTNKKRKSSYNPMDTINNSSQRKSSQENSGSPHLSRAPIFQNLGRSLDSTTWSNMRKMSHGSKYKGFGKKSPSLSTESSLTSLISEPFFTTPATDLVKIKYYYGKKSRNESELMLHNQPIGTYLLRDSESLVGRFTLSFRDLDKMKHLMILPTVNGRYQFQDPELKKEFASLEDAIAFYMNAKRRANFSPQPYIEPQQFSAEGLNSNDAYLLTSEINVVVSKRSASDGSNSYDCISPTIKQKLLPPQLNLYDKSITNADYKQEALPPTPDSAFSISPDIAARRPPSYHESGNASIGDIGRSMTAPSTNYSFPKTYNSKEALPPVPDVSFERIDSSAKPRPILQKQKNLGSNDNIYLESEEGGSFIKDEKTETTESVRDEGPYLLMQTSDAPALPTRSYTNWLSKKPSIGSTGRTLTCPPNISEEKNEANNNYLEMDNSNNVLPPENEASNNYLEMDNTNNASTPENEASNNYLEMDNTNNAFPPVVDEYPYLAMVDDSDRNQALINGNEDNYLTMDGHGNERSAHGKNPIKKKHSLEQMGRSVTLPAKLAEINDDNCYLPMYGSSDDLSNGRSSAVESSHQEKKDNDNPYVNSIAIEMAKSSLNEAAPPLPPRKTKPKKLR